MFNFRKERLVKDSIGQGSFGEVFPYQKNSEDFKWVVKRTKAKKIEDLLRCLPEIVLGFSCDHPCIVPVKGYSIEPKDNKYYVYMRLPRMSGGTLADEIKRRNKKDFYFSENELVKHFYALVSAADYLHNKKISHGDIKINNILLDDKGNIKLCDIGSGKFVPDEDHYNTMTNANGAINYKAPEIIQHERALKDESLKNKSERKDKPMDIILKRDHLYLADSWSLGLTILEICMLEPKLINPHDPVQLIEERFEKIRGEAHKRYSGVLLDTIFDLLKTDPTQRLKVSAVKAKLEENFQQTLTDDFKASLGLQKQSKQEAPDFLNYRKIFNEKADEIVKTFEDDKKAKENTINKFEETLHQLQKKLDAFNLQIEGIKAKKMEEISKKYEADNQTLKQENQTLIEKLEKLNVSNLEVEKNKSVEEISMEYEKSIQILKEENLALIEKLGKQSEQKLQIEKQEVVPKKPRDEEAYRKKLEKVSTELTQKWEECDMTLRYITEDIISNCCKEDLWEEMDGLEMIFSGNSWDTNYKITDEGLKTFASLLSPRLKNLNHLILNMNGWKKITDDGLKEFTSLIISQLTTNLQHLELGMYNWDQVKDQGFGVFISQLAPKLKNVEHLDLDLGSFEKISDFGLTLLASQLGPNLANVKCFKLSINNIRANITDEGLKILASSLGPNLANINTLHLNFYNGRDITSKGLGPLADQITQNLTNLKDITLDLRSCPWVMPSDVKNLKNKLLKKVSKVTFN